MTRKLPTLPPRIARAPERTQPLGVITETARIRGDAGMRLRARILARDYGLCQCDECRAAGRITVAEVVDHIVPLWAGGSNEDANLQSLSRACHDRKTRDENAARGAGATPRRGWGG